MEILARNHRYVCLYLCLNKAWIPIGSFWPILELISCSQYIIDGPPRTETDHLTFNHGWSIGRPRISLFPQHCMGPCVTKPSAAIVLNTQDKQVLILNEEGFPLPELSQCSVWRKNGKCSHNLCVTRASAAICTEYAGKTSPCLL